MKLPRHAAAACRAAAAPKTLWGFLSIVVICATLGFGIYRLAPGKKSAPPRRLWTPLIVNNLDNAMVVPDTLRIEFWTPSSKTKDFLAREPKDAANTNRNWEIIESEEPISRFGEALRKDTDVVGYRRTEVWGHGRTALKPGWWWSITVRTNYPVAKLAKTYRDFWQTSSSVFVEVIDNRGHAVE